MVWCHFSYTNVSCQVFVDDSVFETIHKNMDNKIAELYAATGSKGKGRRNNQPGKGKGKGVSATLDTPFDPRDPFWMKFIRVSWKMTTRSTQPRRKKPRLSSLKTLVPECCCKLQRTNSTSKIAKADKYCKMNNWKQARWHSCFNRWARLRPVVQAVGLAAKRKWSELRKWIFDILNPRVSESSAGWVIPFVANQGGALETLTQKETCCIDIH